jgi:hypothetical protein
MTKMQALAEGFGGAGDEPVPDFEEAVFGDIVEIFGLEVVSLTVDGRGIR